ncbi:PDC sensor domain-containing protein [Pseudomaricurvus sp. HS19]|uniref:PDC sensor domain-containing protein n=1 Tax=Pseudomaricurvus sp. HS19 TaxID=2692626 RepID=UPI00136869F1|nr:PDC sensor domain-containing protein [Pseudomaricurvus sp. HS19]MYM63705.1 hypothetical protein [Pseudomaricurvus sp. HS19]
MDAPLSVSEKRNRRVLALLVCLCLVAALLLTGHRRQATEVRWDEATLRQALQQEITHIRKLAGQPLLVAAVRQQNAEGLSKADILRRDLAWSAGDDTLPLKQQLQNSEATRFLRSQVEGSRVYSEMILTDVQGANVAVYPLSSDYWQGDEAKWREVVLQGRSSYLSPVAADASSDSNVVQLSVPVVDEERTIGVLIVSIRLSHILFRQLH